MEIEARYLRIDWEDRERALRVEVAPEPIEVRVGPDGTLVAETFIFRDIHPWFGLRLAGAAAEEEPTVIMADGARRPMLKVDGGPDGIWWVREDGWDAERQRCLSELHRSPGRFDFLIGGYVLHVENHVGSEGRVWLEECLQNFQEGLIWLAMAFGGGTAVGGPAAVGTELGRAMADFAAAMQHVLKRPARALHETVAATRVERLRPNAASFRQYARNPVARKLVGRGTEETADIAENRYLRHMVQGCETLARAVAGSAAQQASKFRQRAKTEAERCAEWRDIRVRDVEPDVFDRQLAGLERKLGPLEAYSDGVLAGYDDVSAYELKITGRFGKAGNQFFYQKPGSRWASGIEPGIAFSVVELPDTLADLVGDAPAFGGTYTIEGVAKITRRQTTATGKPYRHVHFSHVASVTMHALSAKRQRREGLQANGWQAHLTPKERKEMQQEAHTAGRRAEAYQEHARLAEEAAVRLSGRCEEFGRLDHLWKGMGVEASPTVPTGMLLSSNPAYATCLSAFRRVRALAGQSGIGGAELDAIARVGVLHASALYEKWCLVKIIAVLIEDFRFVPEQGWSDRLIHAVTGSRQIALKFQRQASLLVATLEVQPVLPDGRRPDFRLRFGPEDRLATRGGLVMDAKFRTRWQPGELAAVLDDLVRFKEYGQEGDRVFVLQPAGRSVGEATSPLGWGRDCDYGHKPGEDHRSGMIHLSPGEGASDAVANLRRLIALELQAAFPPPKANGSEPVRWESGSFCIRCGVPHRSEDVHQLSTEASNPYWELRCTSCDMLTTRTHCYGRDCRRTLFKNGVHLTYHETVAEQITNVVCPQCGFFF